MRLQAVPRLPLGILLGAFACTPFVAADAAAQTCAAPLIIAPNTPYAIDTCFTDTSLVLACQMFDLTGPAGISAAPNPRSAPRPATLDTIRPAARVERTASSHRSAGTST